MLGVILYYILLYIIYYTIIIYYIIHTLLYTISYTILFLPFSSFPSSSLPSNQSPPFPPLLSQSSSLYSSPYNPHQSLYTCRYLHTLIYIVLFYSHLLFRYSSNPSHLPPLLFILTHSIRVGTYLRLFIFNPHPTILPKFDPAQTNGVDG